MDVRQGYRDLESRGVLWRFLRRSRTLRRTKRRVLDGRRRRVPRRLGVTGFLSELEERRLRYVLLRWFDDLPDVRRGGDLDILVADDDAEELDEILVRSPITGGVPCDLYSVHGSPAYAYRRLPYYPPALGDRMLDRAIRLDSGAWVPCPEDHFYSLAFHALYHKGFESGLPVSETEAPRTQNAQHDYAKVLATLGAQLGVSAPITMEDLDEELELRGWRPAPDTLLKWSKRNSWCRQVADRILSDVQAPDGLMVCLVRESGADAETVSEIERMADAWGFTRLCTRMLDTSERERAARMVRGGNWERGSWPRSGGPPSALLVALDTSPSVPSQELLARHPGVDNGRVFEFKYQVRSWWNMDQPRERHCNIMHTSDNAAHAAHYLRVILPQDAETILDGSRS